MDDFKPLFEYVEKNIEKKIELKETIKNLGTFNVNIKLFEGVIGILKVNVKSI